MPNTSVVSEAIDSESAFLDPIWSPDAADIERSNIAAAMRSQSFSTYRQLHQWSVAQPTEFWTYVLKALHIKFERPPQQILAQADNSMEARWLPGAQLNIAESCFSAPPDSIAIVCGTEGGDIKRWTYQDLRTEVNRVAHGLRRLGLQSGDPVALFMPMNERSVAMYLGAILAGCPIISIADSLSREQVLLRLRIGEAKAIVTCSRIQRGGKSIPIYERCDRTGLSVILADEIPLVDSPTEPGVTLWQDFLGDATVDSVAHQDGLETINVLFSSGTTGEPKAIPWNHLTPLRAASDGHFHQDIHEQEVVCWPTNFGWMMGPWLTFASLVNRGTMAVFDGAPTGRPFGQFVQTARVNVLGVVPSMVNKWRQSACMEGLDWSNVRLFSSTGECSNPSDMRYLSELAGGKPIIEYCGGTELGGGYIASTVVQPNIPSTFTTPTLGSDFFILNEDGRPCTIGEAYLACPAMGASHRLLNGDHQQVYFEGTPSGPRGQKLRHHGDQLQELSNGCYRALGRTDDAINLGGVKVGCAEIERVLLQLNGIAELAVIAVPQAHGGPNKLVICLSLDIDVLPDKDELRARMQWAISENLCPLFKIDDLFFCSPLPRTASNKLMRRELRRMYDEKQGVKVVQ